MGAPKVTGLLGVTYAILGLFIGFAVAYATGWLFLGMLRSLGWAEGWMYAIWAGVVIIFGAWTAGVAALTVRTRATYEAAMLWFIDIGIILVITITIFKGFAIMGL